MLDNNIRGSLDQMIDQMVSTLPTTLLWLREGKRKADLHINNEKDFALGFAYVEIKATLNANFHMLKSRPPKLEETREADMIIYNRIDELRDAIFRSG
jgi:hypothetical protein